MKTLIKRNVSRIKDPGSAITHFIAMLAAICATTPLLLKAARETDNTHFISLLIFILSMIGLYAASTIYHTLDISPKVYRLLRKLVDEDKRSLIMITHSLGVARELVDRIYVMYAGNIVECATATELFARQLHPYTEGLFACAPRLTGGGISTGIYGYIPDYIHPPKGCRFCNRCQYCKPQCEAQKPPMVEVSPGHTVSCFKYA